MRVEVHPSTLEGCVQSELAIEGVGFTKLCVYPESMEMVCALRRAEAHPQHAAIVGKLRDVLMSAKCKKVSRMVAQAVLSMLFSQSVVYCGVNMAGDLENVLQAYPTGRLSVLDAMSRAS